MFKWNVAQFQISVKKITSFYTQIQKQKHLFTYEFEAVYYIYVQTTTLIDFVTFIIDEITSQDFHY